MKGENKMGLKGRNIAKRLSDPKLVKKQEIEELEGEFEYSGKAKKKAHRKSKPQKYSQKAKGHFNKEMNDEVEDVVAELREEGALRAQAAKISAAAKDDSLDEDFGYKEEADSIHDRVFECGEEQVVVGQKVRFFLPEPAKLPPGSNNPVVESENTFDVF